MAEERLNWLASLYIHADMNIKVDNIIDRFANQGTHRPEFTIRPSSSNIIFEI